MLGSFRTRLSLTVIALVGVTAVLVALISFTLVERSLQNQLIETSLTQADFNIGVLAASGVLVAEPSVDEFVASGLPDRFLQRGPDGVYVEFSGSPDTFASDFNLIEAGSAVSDELRALVAEGRLGYEFVDLSAEPWLVVAGRRPPTGPDFYFFFSQSDIDAALVQLRGVLIASVVGVVLLGALVAGLVSRSMVRPVRTAAHAARTMAEGDLTVRLPVESRDELGQWAESFNQMAASLEMQLAALEEARSREQRFVADVSHELRTPLTGLVAAADVLRSQEDDMGPQTRRLTELVSSDISRLRSLVQDLLEISTLEAAAEPQDLGDVDVDRFIPAVVADRHPDATITSTVGRVVTSRASLERIVGNLLDNAVRHAPGAETTVVATLLDEQLVVEVADAGPGLAPEALPHLFDRFYSADPSRRSGTGLGLAIAREHARRLGGDLSVRLGQPSGLVFQARVPVTIPLHGGEGAATSSIDAESEHDEGGSL